MQGGGMADRDRSGGAPVENDDDDDDTTIKGVRKSMSKITPATPQRLPRGGQERPEVVGGARIVMAMECTLHAGIEADEYHVQVGSKTIGYGLFAWRWFYQRGHREPWSARLLLLLSGALGGVSDLGGSGDGLG